MVGNGDGTYTVTWSADVVWDLDTDPQMNVVFYDSPTTSWLTAGVSDQPDLRTTIFSVTGGSTACQYFSLTGQPSTLTTEVAFQQPPAPIPFDI